MIYSHNKFPESFSLLKQEVKNKAIEIVQLLLKHDYEEDQAHELAISLARESLGKAKSVSLIPCPKGWGLFSESLKGVVFLAEYRSEAIFKARSFAKNQKLKLIIYSENCRAEDCESFAVNRPLRNREHRESIENHEVYEHAADEVRSEVYDGERIAGHQPRFLPKRKHSQILYYREQEDFEARLSYHS